MKLPKIYLLNVLHKLVSVNDQIHFILINYKCYEFSQMNYIINMTSEFNMTRLPKLIKMYPNYRTYVDFTEFHSGHKFISFRLMRSKLKELNKKYLNEEKEIKIILKSGVISSSEKYYNRGASCQSEQSKKFREYYSGGNANYVERRKIIFRYETNGVETGRYEKIFIIPGYDSGL